VSTGKDSDASIVFQDHGVRTRTAPTCLPRSVDRFCAWTDTFWRSLFWMEIAPRMRDHKDPAVFAENSVKPKECNSGPLDQESTPLPLSWRSAAWITVFAYDRAITHSRSHPGVASCTAKRHNPRHDLPKQSFRGRSYRRRSAAVPRAGIRMNRCAQERPRDPVSPSPSRWAGCLLGSGRVPSGRRGEE
jgi:hypothetical protein